jgi:hypothetical protein
MGAEVISKMSEFEAVTPKPRSIPTTFVFAEVREFTIEQLCDGESGGGAMGEMEFMRVADRRACARRASLTNTDRTPVIPWSAVREAEASAPSRAWSPGRRDLPQGRGAHPCCSRLGFRFMPHVAVRDDDEAAGRSPLPASRPSRAESTNPATPISS